MQRERPQPLSYPTLGRTRVCRFHDCPACPACPGLAHANRTLPRLPIRDVPYRTTPNPTLTALTGLAPPLHATTHLALTALSVPALS